MPSQWSEYRLWLAKAIPPNLLSLSLFFWPKALNDISCHKAKGWDLFMPRRLFPALNYNISCKTNLKQCLLHYDLVLCILSVQKANDGPNQGTKGAFNTHTQIQFAMVDRVWTCRSQMVTWVYGEMWYTAKPVCHCRLHRVRWTKLALYWNSKFQLLSWWDRSFLLGMHSVAINSTGKKLKPFSSYIWTNEWLASHCLLSRHMTYRLMAG